MRKGVMALALAAVLAATGAAAGAGSSGGVTAEAQASAKARRDGRFLRMYRKAQAIDRRHYPYVYGGGHDSSFSGPYDCSGAVSAVLHAGGYLRRPLVASQFRSFGRPGDGRVTIYANSGHVYMSFKIGGRRRFFGTSSSNPGGGAGFVSYSSPLPGYVHRHVRA